jgi:hypothetical protein
MLWGEIETLRGYGSCILAMGPYRARTPLETALNYRFLVCGEGFSLVIAVATWQDSVL